MKLFFSGSTRHLNNASEEVSSLQVAARDLGVVAARRQHIVLVTTDSRKTIDRYLVAGVRDSSGELAYPPTVQIHRMRGRRQTFKDRNGRDDRIRFEPISYQAVPQAELDKRLGARVGAINSCDATVLMGGQKGTLLVGQLALALKKPVIAVQAFGGTAAEIFDQEERRYLQMPEVANKLHSLTDSWNGLRSAEGVIEIAEILAGHHTYFLSYSWQNQEQTDHLEALLLRRARTVFRDEEKVNLTEEIKRKLATLIGGADTFIAVWSKDSADSEWCWWERETAERLRKEKSHLKRILFLTLDDTPLPRPWSYSLQPKGTDRNARGTAVAKMIEQEHRS